MQIDQPEGTDANTKGTLQGESGNRKVQKARGRYFGLLKVSKHPYFRRNMSNNTYIFCYIDERKASLLIELLDITWPNQNIYNFKYLMYDEQEELINTWYVVAVQLKFRIKWTTLSTKLGNCMKNVDYITLKRITVPFTEEDELRKEIQHILYTLHLSNIPSVNIADEIKRESEYQVHNNNEASTSKKRKLTWN